MALANVIAPPQPINKSDVLTLTYSGGGGNYVLPNDYDTRTILSISPTSQSTDCNYMFFRSPSTRHWYVHASDFSTGSAVTNATVKMEVYYIDEA